MFKNRSFVYGLGTGVIVGALLLFVMTARSSAPVPSGIALDEMNPLKLKEQASQYYQVFDKETKVYTQADFDSGVKQKVKEEAEKLAASKPQQTPSSTPAQKVIVYIQPNLDATAVTDLLVRSGVVTDRKVFIAELEQIGGNSKIQVGYHEFEGSQDVQKVIANLITRP